MDIKLSSNSVIIHGDIKNVSDFSNIRTQIEKAVATHKKITINIVDSLTITSSVIGYFNKLILKDKIDLEMKIGNEQLMNLLDDLNLISTFKVKKL